MGFRHNKQTHLFSLFTSALTPGAMRTSQSQLELGRRELVFLQVISEPSQNSSSSRARPWIPHSPPSPSALESRLSQDQIFRKALCSQLGLLCCLQAEFTVTQGYPDDRQDSAPLSAVGASQPSGGNGVCCSEVLTRVHTHTCSHAHTYAGSQILSRFHTHTHTHSYTHTLTYTQSYTHTLTYTQSYTHTLTLIHSLTHIHTHYPGF